MNLLIVVTVSLIGVLAIVLKLFSIDKQMEELETNDELNAIYEESERRIQALGDYLEDDSEKN